MELRIVRCVAVSEKIPELRGQFLACGNVAGCVAIVHGRDERLGPIDQRHDPSRTPLQHGQQPRVFQVAPVADHVPLRLLRPRMRQARDREHVHLRVDVAAEAGQVGDLRPEGRGAHADRAREAERPSRRVHLHALAALLRAAIRRRGAAEREGGDQPAAEQHSGELGAPRVGTRVAHRHIVRVKRGTRKVGRDLQVHRIVRSGLVAVGCLDGAAHDNVLRPARLRDVKLLVAVLRVLRLDLLLGLA
mmetsp:Transcript_62418/g.190870  ORF Transcript_62418/g.190870 Transcript_62418/m.190870 type:complete len:247 (-) Transcript_62418:355-1095(-)